MTEPLPKVIQQEVHVIAAAPGFNLIGRVIDHGKVVDVWREPIIAWLIETRTTTPITVRGVFDGNKGGWAIELPGGCCDLQLETFDNAAELLKFWREEEAAKERHSDGCPYLYGDECNCNPEIKPSDWKEGYEE